MTDHRTIVAALPKATRATLTTRSNTRGLLHLGSQVGALLVTGTYIAIQPPLWGLFILPHGILMVFLFTLSHECTHQTPFRTPWLNDCVGVVIAPLLVLPFFWFRYFHLAHHRFTNDPERDPELADGARPTTWPDYLIYVSGWGYWRSNLTTLWRNAFGPIDAPYLPPRRHAVMRREARVLIGLYVLFAISLLWSPLLLWLWLVPVLVAQPFLRLYLLAEHGHCPQVANMLENSRTTLTSRAVRWLAWNMPYHAEHHSYPAVPFHQLPALHALMADDLHVVAPSYTTFTKRYAGALER
ncbi:MAG: fatty acid desaturase [Pseudomonadota bacterium]